MPLGTKAKVLGSNFGLRALLVMGKRGLFKRKELIKMKTGKWLSAFREGAEAGGKGSGCDCEKDTGGILLEMETFYILTVYECPDLCCTEVLQDARYYQWGKR